MQYLPPQVALIASATCVLAVVAIIAGFFEFGPHAQHMIMHIMTMNVAAPMISAIALTRCTGQARGRSLLWFTTAVQIAVLWTWHAPIAQRLMLHTAGGMGAMHIALLVAAIAFWSSLFTLPAFSRWQAIPALLLTGKLVCLLAALLVFAPRTLYGTSAHSAPSLDDQHLAGLLMLAACPLSYLVAAVCLTVHLIGVDKTTAESPPAPGGAVR
jgi:putative membrane protein